MWYDFIYQINASIFPDSKVNDTKIESNARIRKTCLNAIIKDFDNMSLHLKLFRSIFSNKETAFQS